MGQGIFIRGIRVMKKILILISLLFVLAGCYSNYSVIDVNYHYNYAKVLTGETIIKEGKVQEWRDYQNSDSVSIVFEDGTKIYTHISNVILIEE